MGTFHSSRSINAFVIILAILAVTLACGTGTTGNGLNVETQVALTMAVVNGGSVVATVSPTCNNIDFNGISLCYDPSIAQGVTTSVIPAASSADAVWFNTPQTEQIDFTGYITGGKFHKPVIMVYSVDEFKAINTNAEKEIADLQQYIANKPNIPAGTIPFLPPWNAQQLFNVLPAFVSFQNGQGIRYLAEYGQYYAPVNNTDLFYTFQGITNDGKYYISVILPVTHPSLPPDYQVDKALQDQILSDYNGYLAGILPVLSAQPLDSFSPNISLLDAMIQSMKIH
jgi:hypothetical protein